MSGYFWATSAPNLIKSDLSLLLLWESEVLRPSAIREASSLDT